MTVHSTVIRATLARTALPAKQLRTVWSFLSYFGFILLVMFSCQRRRQASFNQWRWSCCLFAFLSRNFILVMELCYVHVCYFDMCFDHFSDGSWKPWRLHEIDNNILCKRQRISKAINFWANSAIWYVSIHSLLDNVFHIFVGKTTSSFRRFVSGGSERSVYSISKHFVC